MLPIAEYVRVRRIIDNHSRLPKWNLATIDPINSALSKISAAHFLKGVEPEFYHSNFSILSGDKSVDFENCSDIDALCALAEPAPFGRGGETVIDPTVRNALQIPAAKIESPLKDTSGLPWNVYGEINTLMNQPGKKLQPELYKMHIYRAGGFFQPHTDTAHAANHVGTLIVSLYSEHTGGRLVVKHHGQEHVFDTESQKPDEIRWCAFFTDCTHHVEPVVSGTRVVLQFDLFLETAERDTEYDELFDRDTMIDPSATRKRFKVQPVPKVPEGIRNELIQSIRQHFADKSCRSMGILLQHKYVQQLGAMLMAVFHISKAVFPYAMHRYVNSGLRLDLLRGSDAALAEALKDAFAIKTSSVLLASTCNPGCNPDRQYVVHRLTPQIFAYADEKASESESESDDDVAIQEREENKQIFCVIPFARKIHAELLKASQCVLLRLR